MGDAQRGHQPAGLGHKVCGAQLSLPIGGRPAARRAWPRAGPRPQRLRILHTRWYDMLTMVRPLLARSVTRGEQKPTVCAPAARVARVLRHGVPAAACTADKRLHIQSYHTPAVLVLGMAARAHRVSHTPATLAVAQKISKRRELKLDKRCKLPSWYACEGVA